MSGAPIRVRAPGRVNLIGDHTDYTGGLVMPMTIDRWTEISGVRGGSAIRLRSADEPVTADVVLPVDDPARVQPPWARYVAGVAAEMRPDAGFDGTVITDIPIGAGLSSSAALEVAAALALGFRGAATELATLCQRAEQRASGVPSGIMDQLTITSGVDGHALLIDCHSLVVSPVPLPADAEIVVLFVAHRTLVGSAYADRVAECAGAEAAIGPLRIASVDDVARITDDVVRHRAMHVVTENERVRRFAAALGAGDLPAAGALMLASHVSLRDLYDTSTPAMDAVVERLAASPGVHGARMTGGGFGGCVVALTRPGALAQGWPSAWVVRAVDAAYVVGGNDRQSEEQR